MSWTANSGQLLPATYFVNRSFFIQSCYSSQISSFQTFLITFIRGYNGKYSIPRRLWYVILWRRRRRRRRLYGWSRFFSAFERQKSKVFLQPLNFVIAGFESRFELGFELKIDLLAVRKSAWCL
jgi:hypothetical protein